ncbi:periplasmic binding protein-like I [Chytridium lagenaria]|nr:periplasmic binding protein-like I [Chytridium lagenaria]
MPFAVPFNVNDEQSVVSSSVQTLNTGAVYNALIWYMNRTNNDPSVLPDTRIELVPINSRLDRGVSLRAALQLISQERVVAIIGESSSRNTVTMAVAAAVNNVLHCSNLATSPQLSNKVDYPTTFRTQSNAACNLGNGMTQLLQQNAALYNVTISSVIIYEFSKTDFKSDLRPFIDNRIQTIITIAASFPVVNIMRSAAELNMLDGSHWFITTTGWTEIMFASPSSQALLPNITGVWQVQNPLYKDDAVEGGNAEAVALRQWWTDFFISNESTDQYPGVTRTFNVTTHTAEYTAMTANLTFPSNCPNDTQLNIAAEIPNFVTMINRNTGMMVQAAGNMCSGPNLRYLEGYLSMFAISAGYMAPRPRHQQPSPLTNVNSNISQLLNTPNLTDLHGNPLQYDTNADLQMEQDLIIYRFANISSRRRVVAGVSSGKWWRRNNSVTLSGDMLFLGGKLTPPPTPVIPVVQFKANRGMRWAFVGVTAVCMLITVLLFVYMVMYRTMKIFVASSPIFLALSYSAPNISYVGIYLFSMYPMDDGSCIVFGWLKYLGFAVVFGALLVKMDSVAKVATNGTVLQFESDAALSFWGLQLHLFGAMVLTLAYGVWLTYLVREHANLLAIYNWVVIGIVLNAIANFAVKDPDVIFVMEALVVIITQTGVAIL